MPILNTVSEKQAKGKVKKIYNDIKKSSTVNEKLK